MASHDWDGILASDDVSSLKQFITSIRSEWESKAVEREGLTSQLAEVRKSHEELLSKSANWKDELETASTRMASIQAEVESHKAATQEAEDRVKDLRLRAEESRRAFMRLQGEQENVRKAAKAEHRRSMGNQAFASAMLGNSVSPVPSPALGSSGPADDDEAKALKKSKRASMAFGPNGTISIGAAAATARANGRLSNLFAQGAPEEGAFDSQDNQATPPSSLPTSGSAPQITAGTTPPAGSTGGANGSRGLKGLSLLGNSHHSPSPSISGSIGFSASGGPGSNTGGDSRRTSVLSSIASPLPHFADLPSGAEDASAARRSSPPSNSLATRRYSRGHTGAGGELGLFVPSNSVGTLAPGPSSPVPSVSALSSVGSPILEDEEAGEGTNEFMRRAGGARSPSPFLSASQSAMSQSAISVASSGGGMSTLATMRLEAQLQAKHAEVERLRLEMNGLRNRVDEAVEARQASEVCLKALREFIATGDAASPKGASNGPEANGGSVRATGLAAAFDLTGVKLPPLPTDLETNQMDDEVASRGPAKTWGLRLSTLPGMMRKTTGDSTESYVTSSASTATSMASEQTSATSIDAGDSPKPDGSPPNSMNPSSFSSFWSRTVSSVAAARDSALSATTTTAPNGASLANRLSLQQQLQEGEASDSPTPTATFAPPLGANLTSPPAGALKGISGWFNKRQTAQEEQLAKAAAEAEDGEATPVTPSRKKMPSPPFASLDLSEPNKTPTSATHFPRQANLFRTTSGSSLDDDSPNSISSGDKIPARNAALARLMNTEAVPASNLPALNAVDVQATARVRRNQERTASVTSDEGFVPPTFD